MIETEEQSIDRFMLRMANSDLPELLIELANYCEQATLEGDDLPECVEHARSMAYGALAIRGARQ